VPPLIISRDEIDLLIERLGAIFEKFEGAKGEGQDRG
jgi:hypothetical protein